MNYKELSGTVNLNLVRELLQSDISSYRIANETGISARMVGRYRMTDYDIGGIALSALLELQDFAKKNKKSS